MIEDDPLNDLTRTQTAQGSQVDEMSALDAALAPLKAWAGGDRAKLARALAELGGAAELSREYPDDFKVDVAYRDSLPDLQNGPESAIQGAVRRIEQVGISGFRLPLSFEGADGPLQLETVVTGTVSLEAHRKGINMSRIMRSFYAEQDGLMSFAKLEQILRRYLVDLDAQDASLQLRVSYPELRPSLRSGLEGYQYYDATFEVGMRNGMLEKALHLDYVYSSTCPCSLELAEHARARGQLATPHSQRSVARISVALVAGADLPLRDLIAHARSAVTTETQVMVKREDEQAFAELNAANPIFVEDAVRLFAQPLIEDPRISDFRIAASHQESLHSHDAVAVLSEGTRFGPIEPRGFASLTHSSRA